MILGIKPEDVLFRILFMHFYERPNGERVICAGGQDGYVLLSFHNQGDQQLIEITFIDSTNMIPV